MDFFNYTRRPTIDVHVGNITMGGNHPVVIQTMTSTNTLDTEASVAQCERIIASGADLIRLTTQGVREANNLREIHRQLRRKVIRRLYLPTFISTRVQPKWRQPCRESTYQPR